MSALVSVFRGKTVPTAVVLTFAAAANALAVLMERLRRASHPASW